MRAFLACVGEAPAGPLESALAHYGQASAWREGALYCACTGARPDRRLLLSGDVHTLDEIARVARVRAQAPPEEILDEARRRLGEVRLLGLLRGEFALLWWEPDGRRLVAVRDQMGQQGLLYCRRGASTLVAAETAELQAALPVTPAVDPVGLAHWLAIEGLPADVTLLAGVRRVPAGHLLEVSGADVRVRRYWQPARPLAAGSADPDGAAAQVRDALARAVRRRAPDTAGVLLSGGLDSCAVAAVGVRGLRPPALTRAYSAVFPRHPTADETPLIELTADTLKLALVKAVVEGGSVIAGALPYIERWLTPPATPNLFFWLPLLRGAARDGIEVLLDGQGGDELFGLAPALLADRLRRGDLLGAVRLVARVPGAGLRPPPRELARWLYHHGVKGALPPSVAGLRRRLQAAAAPAPPWLGGELAAALERSVSAGAWKQPGAPRWWSYLVAATVDGPGPTIAFDDLRRRDGLAGVRSRHPLADVDLVELVLALAPELAYHPRHSRPLLREAVSGLLVDRVRLRISKSNFDGPFHDALAGVDLALARELLRPGVAEIGSHVDLSRVAAELLDRPPPAGQRQGWALWLWRLLTAELWLRTLADGGYPERLRASGSLASSEVALTGP